MLCQFTVKNFKSIRDEMTFDMQAAAISEHEDRVIKDRDGELFLPVSAVYGPNGGGKSNVLEALHSLVFKVLRPLYATSDSENAVIRIKRILIEPFAFSAETVNAPTEFELFFRTRLAEYRYELTVRKDVIEYERLDRVKLETGRRSALFERDENEITLKGVFSKLKTSEDLSETLPLLSYLGITYAKNEVVQDVLSWFDNGIDFLNYGNPRQELRMAISNSDHVKKLMLDMIQEMDLDIVGIPDARPGHLKQCTVLQPDIPAVPEGILPLEQAALQVNVSALLQRRLPVREGGIVNGKVLPMKQGSLPCQKFLSDLFHNILSFSQFICFRKKAHSSLLICFASSRFILTWHTCCMYFVSSLP